MWSRMSLVRERVAPVVCVFFFNDTATTEIYTLSLHDALPIYTGRKLAFPWHLCIVHQDRYDDDTSCQCRLNFKNYKVRSEEHTSELQSRQYLVCRLLLEKK